MVDKNKVSSFVKAFRKVHGALDPLDPLIGSDDKLIDFLMDYIEGKDPDSLNLSYVPKMARWGDVPSIEGTGLKRVTRRKSVQKLIQELHWLYKVLYKVTKVDGRIYTTDNRGNPEHEVQGWADVVSRKKGQYRVTTNAFKRGRFYTFKYVPRWRDIRLPIWDAQPIIFCLDAHYHTHFLKNHSNPPIYGILGINIHYLPTRYRREVLKNLLQITDVNRKTYRGGNIARMRKNRDLIVSINTVTLRTMELCFKYGAIRQYLRAGTYPEYELVQRGIFEKHGRGRGSLTRTPYTLPLPEDKSLQLTGEFVKAGAYGIRQIPYDKLPDVFAVPSINDDLNYVYDAKYRDNFGRSFDKAQQEPKYAKENFNHL